MPWRAIADPFPGSARDRRTALAPAAANACRRRDAA